MIYNLKDRDYISKIELKDNSDLEIIDFAGKLLLKMVDVQIKNKDVSDLTMYTERTAYELFEIVKRGYLR